MTIEERLQAELERALREGDRATRDVIRQIRSEVGVARTAPGFRGEVDDDLYRRVITSYVKRMKKARASFAAAGERGAEQVAKIDFEVDFLSRFLPQALGEDETRALVRRTIAELGVDDPKLAGQVIGAVMKSGEEVDGALVARIVREELGA
ncbi:MAG TPA: hypothetical protein ENK55_10740 [Actinobacteria bacterium]|nr:hypothetical protein [Actinomycetota bacterium]